MERYPVNNSSRVFVVREYFIAIGEMSTGEYSCCMKRLEAFQLHIPPLWSVAEVRYGSGLVVLKAKSTLLPPSYRHCLLFQCGWRTGGIGSGQTYLWCSGPSR